MKRGLRYAVAGLGPGYGFLSCGKSVHLWLCLSLTLWTYGGGNEYACRDRLRLRFTLRIRVLNLRPPSVSTIQNNDISGIACIMLQGMVPYDRTWIDRGTRDGK